MIAIFMMLILKFKLMGAQHVVHAVQSSFFCMSNADDQDCHVNTSLSARGSFVLADEKNGCQSGMVQSPSKVQESVEAPFGNHGLHSALLDYTKPDN
jgi:hypothetical protein